MSFAESLFSDEERTIARGEELLSAGQAMLPASEYLDLLDSYRKLYRQSSRLVKMGDRIQGQLNRLNEQLVVSEEKYRSIFEGSIQGIYRSTPEGRFRVLNPAMARIFGFDSCQEMLRQVEDIGRDIYLSQVQRREFLLTLRARGMVKNHPLQLRRRDGALIWVECSTRGYFDDAGNIVEMEGMVQDVTEKRSMLQELENLARRDGLTGLWNRRYFMELGRREMSRVDRERAPLSLVYFDVDHFKSINDSHGHETGDKVLQEIAELGQGMLRKKRHLRAHGGRGVRHSPPRRHVEGCPERCGEDA